MTSRHSSYWYFLSSEQRIFFILLRLPGNGYSLLCSQKQPPRHSNYFSSKERNSELVPLPLYGLERNSKCLLLFCSTERNSELFSLPRNGSERNSKSFLFHGTAGIPPEQTNCSDYSVFRGIIFWVGNCQPHCWGIREVARRGKYFLSYEGRAMKGRDMNWEG